MRNIWTICAREFKHYFISPIAYVVAFIVLIVIGIWFFANIFFATNNPQYIPGIENVLSPMVILLLFAAPAITMRSVAEEQRSGTLELLLTAPVRDWELIVGKWLGAFLLLFVIIITTIIYPLILNQLIDPGIDQGLLLSYYLGFTLLAAAFVSIGVAVSSLFSNQIAAFITTLGILLILMIAGSASQAVGSSDGGLLQYIDWQEHLYSTFLQGIIELKSIVYYLSLISLSLFTGTISIEIRRWK